MDNASRRVTRGCIRVNGAIYYSPELVASHDELVEVECPPDSTPATLCVLVAGRSVVLERQPPQPRYTPAAWVRASSEHQQ